MHVSSAGLAQSPTQIELVPHTVWHVDTAQHATHHMLTHTHTARCTPYPAQAVRWRSYTTQVHKHTQYTSHTMHASMSYKLAMTASWNSVGSASNVLDMVRFLHTRAVQLTKCCTHMHAQHTYRFCRLVRPPNTPEGRVVSAAVSSMSLCEYKHSHQHITQCSRTHNHTHIVLSLVSPAKAATSTLAS